MLKIIVIFGHQGQVYIGTNCQKIAITSPILSPQPSTHNRSPRLQRVSHTSALSDLEPQNTPTQQYVPAHKFAQLLPAAGFHSRNSSNETPNRLEMLRQFSPFSTI